MISRIFSAETGQHFDFLMVDIATEEECVNNIFTSSSFSVAKIRYGIPDGILLIIEGVYSNIYHI